MTVSTAKSGPVDRALRERAAVALPNGVYGHLDAGLLWPGAPQFVSRAEGSRFWDADGKEYIDLMCSWGPILLGHRHPAVEQAVRIQHELVDCANGPAAAMVDLAERLVGVVDHADWAMLGKNGGDATTLSLTIARAHTNRSTILAAEGTYHGSLPWCSPSTIGVVPGDRAHIDYFRYNDMESVYEAVQAHGGDVAAIIVSPFRHDAGYDQELPQLAFAQGLRQVCDNIGALLIIDDVRCGFRLAFGCSWEPLGVAPDLSAWSKALANGYPIAAVLGSEHLRAAASSVFATGSFWFAADSMAAALSTIDVLEQEQGVAKMHTSGQAIWDGIEKLAAEREVPISLTGHMTMPYLSFGWDGSQKYGELFGVPRPNGELFASVCGERGVFLHPRHNWFISAALSEEDIEEVLAAMGHGFDAVAERAGPV